jgi:hypothetical protein
MALPTPLQQGLEELVFGFAGDHARAELTEHSAIKARIH